MRSMLPSGGLRQVALNNQAVPLRRVPRTNDGTRLIHQRRRRENSAPDRFSDPPPPMKHSTAPVPADFL